MSVCSAGLRSTGSTLDTTEVVHLPDGNRAADDLSLTRARTQVKHTGTDCRVVMMMMILMMIITLTTTKTTMI